MIFKKRNHAIKEDVAESVYFVGPEKGGETYRFVVVRRKNNQLALFLQSTNTPTGFILLTWIGINIKSFTFTDNAEMRIM